MHTHVLGPQKSLHRFYLLFIAFSTPGGRGSVLPACRDFCSFLVT